MEQIIANCVHASSVNISKHRVDTDLVTALTLRGVHVHSQKYHCPLPAEMWPGWQSC